MARCHFCDTETVLFDSGTPICVTCDGKRQQRPNAPHARLSDNLASVLYEEMRTSRADYIRISVHADEETRLAQDMGPDGILAWKHAYEAQYQSTKALARYQLALREFTDHVINGRKP